VLIAFFSDIHANRQAFEACLVDARRRGAQRIVLLGDYVGYGADPEWVVDKTMELVGQGALAVLGNHDSAIGNDRENLHEDARLVIGWTRGRLDVAQRDFLAALPYTIDEAPRLYVHADASAPKRWIYVASKREAADSLAATSATLTVCGHIHIPALYSMSAGGKLSHFTPASNVPIPLLPGRRWLAVAGAVGQPRDGDPAAAYLLLDPEKNEITYCRCAYDVEAAAKAIIAQGLPAWFGDRLLAGR